MTFTEIKSALEKVNLGKFTKVHYRTIKGEYTKETETVIRFVQYGHIEGVEVKGKPNPNEEYIIPHVLVYNRKNGEHYLVMATTKTPYKASVKYFHNDTEISKEEYDLANPSKPSATPLVIFKKNIKDIISIG